MLLYLLTRRALTSGASVLLEANFTRASEVELGALAALADTRIILCRADPMTRRARFTHRDGRHGVHLDAEILEHEWSDDDAQFAIDIGVPRLVVDTTSGYTPTLEVIERFARR
jgi:predicted kinase